VRFIFQAHAADHTFVRRDVDSPTGDHDRGSDDTADHSSTGTDDADPYSSIHQANAVGAYQSARFDGPASRCYRQVQRRNLLVRGAPPRNVLAPRRGRGVLQLTEMRAAIATALASVALPLCACASTASRNAQGTSPTYALRQDTSSTSTSVGAQLSTTSSTSPSSGGFRATVFPTEDVLLVRATPVSHRPTFM
jgi:hypothetical protein